MSQDRQEATCACWKDFVRATLWLRFCFGVCKFYFCKHFVWFFQRKVLQNLKQCDRIAEGRRCWNRWNSIRSRVAICSLSNLIRWSYGMFQRNNCSFFAVYLSQFSPTSASLFRDFPWWLNRDFNITWLFLSRELGSYYIQWNAPMSVKCHSKYSSL